MKDGLDGWFTSIEDRGGVELVLINDPELFTAGPVERYQNDSQFSYDYDDDLHGGVIPTNFGTNYPISTLTKPVALMINRDYEEWYRKYMITAMKQRYMLVVQVVLRNAQIMFTDYEGDEAYDEDDISQLHWNHKCKEHEMDLRP